MPGQRFGQADRYLHNRIGHIHPVVNEIIEEETYRLEVAGDRIESIAEDKGYTRLLTEICYPVPGEQVFSILSSGLRLYSFISFLVVSPIGICMLLVLQIWKGQKFARVYYGIAVVLLSVALTFLFGKTVWDMVDHQPVNRGQLAIYIGAYVGIVGGFGNLLRAVPHRALKTFSGQPSHHHRSPIQTLIDRSIFMLSWAGISMTSRARPARPSRATSPTTRARR
jgi:hypothetical protein